MRKRGWGRRSAMAGAPKFEIRDFFSLLFLLSYSLDEWMVEWLGVWVLRKRAWVRNPTWGKFPHALFCFISQLLILCLLFWSAPSILGHQILIPKFWSTLLLGQPCSGPFASIPLFLFFILFLFFLCLFSFICFIIFF